MSDFTFYLGTHRPNWLWSIEDVPLFISHRVLKDRKGTFPRATTSWALDSGGFTELNLYGEWRTSARSYIADVRRYVEEIGNLAWASPQDWMCEPFVTAKTGLSIATHQWHTVANYLTLRELDGELPIVPVLQGWQLDDYQRHADMYESAGVDLASLPLVGIGSVCRRQATGAIAGVFDSLMSRGLRMHGYGVKSAGLAQYADALTSADSLAWSYGARQDARAGIRHCAKNTCANCLHYALDWRRKVLSGLETRQYSFTFGGAA